MAEKQYIVFKLNDEKYATSINHIASITDYSSITPLPNGPAYVDGLLNLRGDIIPIVNMKKRFRLNEDDVTDRRIIISHNGDVQIGFLVDDASQSMTVDEAAILPPPKVAIRKDNNYISEVCIYRDELIVVVDLNKVLSPEEVDELVEDLL
ncbi:chemotaxis protein CheW [Fusibacter sp. JL298sf-3]